MRLLESSSSLEAMPAPFLSFVERGGTTASSSLESPFCPGNQHIKEVLELFDVLYRWNQLTFACDEGNTSSVS
jgi:hypothetical protein